MHVNLAQPLVSKVRTANKIHRIEYESLPQICFSCGRFGHLKNTCPIESQCQGNKGVGKDGIGVEALKSQKEGMMVQDRVEKETFGDWMVVERQQQ